MSEKVKSVFDALQNEVVWLHSRYLSYEKLYGKSEERIALLNSSSSSFFYHLQFILLDDIELVICKLLDPAKQGSNLNLTLERLLMLIDDSIKIKSELIRKLAEARDASKSLREKRNKRLSHFDLQVSISRPAEFFTKASRIEIENILTLIRDFLNLIDSHFWDSTLAYEHFSSSGDAESLINSLKKSEAYNILEKENLIEHGYWRTSSPFKNA